MASLLIVLAATLSAKQCALANEVIVNALLESDIVLPCDHGIEHSDVDTAQWFKCQQPGVRTLPIAQKFGEKWNVSEKYNLTANFSLLVADVEVTDEARYKCFVRPFSLQNDYEGFVLLRLLAYPEESTSLIEKCDASDVLCRRTVVVGDFVVVTCRAKDVYPETYPEWTITGINNTFNLSRTSTQNSDGTYTTSVDIIIDVSVVSETELTCTFDYGVYSRSSSLLLQAIPINTTAQANTNTVTSNTVSTSTSTMTTTDSNTTSPVVTGLAVGLTVALIVIVLIVVVVLLLIKRKTISCKRCPKQQKDEKVPPENPKIIYSELSADEKRAAFRDEKQLTILDDYKLKT